MTYQPFRTYHDELNLQFTSGGYLVYVCLVTALTRLMHRVNNPHGICDAERDFFKLV